MYKILTIIGARPQFIKAAAISKVILERNDVHEILVHTGQHYDEKMSSVFFNELGLPREHYNLEIGSASHAAMTAGIMLKLEGILIKEDPDCVLLYGDTNSTVAAALTAAKLHIPVVHVEAGIRSKRKNRPEEVNRIITDHLSSVLFPPTFEGEENLRNESIVFNKEKRASNDNPIIANFGDVMYDNFLRLFHAVDNHKGVLEENGVFDYNFILLTIHRALNTDNPEKLKRILTAINEISLSDNIKVLFPAHPRTQKQMQSNELAEVYDTLKKNSNFIVIEPVSFIEMMVLQKYSKLIITDSGGVQKEAAFFCKKCIVLLDSTPWKELVRAGVLVEVGDHVEKINAAYTLLKNDANSKFPEIFGDGNASRKMLNEIIAFIKKFRTYKDEIKFQ